MYEATTRTHKPITMQRNSLVSFFDCWTSCAKGFASILLRLDRLEEASSKFLTDNRQTEKGIIGSIIFIAFLFPPPLNFEKILME